MKSSSMKTMKDLVGNMNIAKHQEKAIVVDEFAKSVINKVFDELSLIFPAWKHNWKSDNPAEPDKVLKAAKLQWTKAFIENDIVSLDQIKHGFARARRTDSDFLPSCGKFVSWCTPSPQDLGWPSSIEALKKCIEYRSGKKLFGNKAKYCRPMIIELCKGVDWWLMSNVSNSNDRKRADLHFGEVYMSLLNSGYVEPQTTDYDRLPTQETVKAGMSEQQVNDKIKRDCGHIDDIKNMFKKAKQLNNKD